ncbi:hypothetical protein AB0J80_25135 [Actinoplanes sp. NPDC049548]|uniref:hypothetical protein n=1 Tax=Actinoplanes sp. NPDC049548 TaxID=3155152 RepID=UPI00343B561E
MGERPGFRAAQRTDLLHRMLLVRRLEERRSRPAGSGDEAVAVGLLTALGPLNAVVAAGAPRPWHTVGAAALLFGGDVTTAPGPAEAVATARAKTRAGDRRIVAVCLTGTGPLPPAVHADLPIVFCRGEHLAAAGTLPAVTVLSVDSDDVEAITGAATAEIGALRTGTGPCLLELRPHAGGEDPVELLAARMRIDHQLDDNTLRAIDRAAAARAEEVLQRLGGP